MTVPDSSVLVAGFVPSHRFHEVAVAAREASAELVTLDRRAAPVYSLCGADVHLLGD